MKAVLDDFELRLDETKSFLRMLKLLDAPDASIGSSATSLTPVQDDWRRVSKATAFLMLYNVVEAAIRSAFSHLYNQVTASGCTAATATSQILEVWIDQQHRLLTRETASPSNYRNSAASIVAQVIAKAVLELNPEKLPVSGNLDAQAIRELFTKHGIPCKTPQKAKGGIDLKLVKDQRNALAHGDKTFSECGRETTVADLQRIADQVDEFMRSALRNLGRYIRGKSYRTKTRRSGVA
jgi:hypothetical protein